jgi:hypothetical protein
MATINKPIDDDKMNSHFKKLQEQYKKTVDSKGEDVKDIPHNTPPAAGTTPTGPMKGNLMNWTQMLESMDEVSENIDTLNDPDIEDAPIETPDPAPVATVDDDELLNELNQIFTPILVMQGFEGSIADQINEAFSEASVLTEKNIISFDNETRMAQLISICALLIAKQKNSEKYQMYKKAAVIKNKMKLDIQKDEYDAAQALAQKFLVKVATTNNSSVARYAANELLPETQH